MSAEMGFLEGAGCFWAATASLVARVPLRVRHVPCSLSRSKITPANVLQTPCWVHKCSLPIGRNRIVGPRPPV